MSKVSLSKRELKLVDAGLIHLMNYSEKMDDGRKFEIEILWRRIHKKRLG